jgi:hypothetical protein
MVMGAVSTTVMGWSQHACDLDGGERDCRHDHDVEENAEIDRAEATGKAAGAPE